MSDKAEQFFEALQTAVKTDQLVLPTLPEVALKIRDAVDSEASSAQDIAEMMRQDASLSARLIQVANSPLYRTRNPVDDLQMAVTRLGIRLVRNLVSTLAMKQIFQATSDELDRYFRDIWNTAVEVASISRMLAAAVPGISAEQALLAGLIHNIGALPILVMADENDELFSDTDELNGIVTQLQGRVGGLILRSWNFPDHMIEVVERCHDFGYDHGGGANLVDLIQVSILQGNHAPAGLEPGSWGGVPAFAKLGMDTEQNMIEIEENQQVIEETRQSLMI